MTKISNQNFEGERPLYNTHGAEIDHVVIGLGESALKECSEITVRNSRFEGKYAMWRIKGLKVEDCTMTTGARASLWYTDQVSMDRCQSEAPKMFRDCHGVSISDSHFTDAIEMLWHCDDVRIKNVQVEGADYFCLQSSNIEVDGLQFKGGYAFQYARNVVVRNSVIVTKDAFWETDNCTVYDSKIDSQYLAWHSRNLRLVRCHITGEQPLCYAEGLVLEDCTFGPDANLAFEYSDVQATILSDVHSIKNPHHGSIRVQGKIGEIILDGNRWDGSDCAIL